MRRDTRPGRRGSCRLTVALLAVLTGPVAWAQDVYYSESRNGVYSRYEQYGYGPNAYVRYRQSAASPAPAGYASPYLIGGPGFSGYGTAYAPAPGLVRSYDEHERYGPAPAFGSFYGGLIGRSGPTPGALFESLGPGVRGQGVSRAEAMVAGSARPIPLRETRYVYPDPNPQAISAPTVTPRPSGPAPAPAASKRPRIPPPPPVPAQPNAAPDRKPPAAPGAVPPPPAPAFPG